VISNREMLAKRSQARERINPGETGDKKAVTGPATAPLGTDAEAAGTSTRSEQAAPSFAAERGGSAEPAAAQGRELERPGSTLVILGLAGTAVGAVVLEVALLLAG
jgi:hypothetical protein